MRLPGAGDAGDKAHVTWPGYGFSVHGPRIFDKGPIFRLFLHCHLKYYPYFSGAMSSKISSQPSLMKILRLVHHIGPDWAVGLARRVTVVKGGRVTLLSLARLHGHCWKEA